MINRSSRLLGTHPLNSLFWSHSSLKLERLPTSRRYLPAQAVEGEVQLCQVGEAAQLRRYLPAQLVAEEVQPYNAPGVVGGDALPFAEGSVAQPVVVDIQFSPPVAL